MRIEKPQSRMSRRPCCARSQHCGYQMNTVEFNDNLLAHVDSPWLEPFRYGDEVNIGYGNWTFEVGDKVAGFGITIDNE
jgi:hypothetical protein